MKTTVKKLVFALACATAALPAVSHAAPYESTAVLSFEAQSNSATYQFSWVDLITVWKEWTTESDGKYSLILTNSKNKAVFKDKNLGDNLTGDVSGVTSGSFTQMFSGLKVGDAYKLTFVGNWNSQGNKWVSSTTPSVSISAVPEPETYAMFLAGLGLIGGIALRRAKKS